MPGHWRSSAGVRGERRPAALPPDVRAGTPLEPGHRRFLDLRRHLLLRRHLARRRVPRRDRGLLLPAHVRGHRPGPRRARRRSPPRGRGRVPAAARPHQEADHHRRLLALGQPRPGLEPRRHLAPGPAARHRPGADQVAARAVHARRPRPAAGCCSTSRSTPAPTRSRSRSARGSFATVTGPDGTLLAATTRDVMLAAGDNTLTLTVEVDHPPRWWPWRLGAQPQCDVEVGSRSTGCRATTAGSAPRSARCACKNWQLTVNGERMFPMGSNHGPTRMALAEATAPGADPRRAARGRREPRPAAHPRARHPARALRRGRRGRAPALAGPPAAVGLRARHAQGGGAPGPRDGRPARPPPEHRDVVRAQRAARDRPPTGRRDPRPRRREDRGVDVPADAGTRTSSTARSRARCTRPTRPARSTRTRACSRASAAAGPTPTSTSAGTTARWTGSRRRCARCRASRASSPSSARRPSPTPPTSCTPSVGPTSTGTTSSSTTRCQKRYFDLHVPPALFESFAAWRDATQHYQAALIQLQIEDLRRLATTRPAASATSASPTAIPSVTWSVLDHDRVPEGRVPALRDACRTRAPDARAPHRPGPRRERGPHPARRRRVEADVDGPHTAGPATSAPTASPSSAASTCRRRAARQPHAAPSRRSAT